MILLSASVELNLCWHKSIFIEIFYHHSSETRYLDKLIYCRFIIDIILSWENDKQLLRRKWNELICLFKKNVGKLFLSSFNFISFVFATFLLIQGHKMKFRKKKFNRKKNIEDFPFEEKFVKNEGKNY